MSYRELQAEAKRLGIKANQKVDVLRAEIAKHKAKSSSLSPRKGQSQSLPITPRKQSSSSVDSLDLISAEWVVFCGGHIYLDDETRTELQRRLIADGGDIKLLFYYDGSDNLDLVYPPLSPEFQSIKIGNIYSKAVKDEVNGGTHRFTGAAIGFNSAFMSLDIWAILRDILPVGGLHSPINISLISDESLGADQILVYNFDTYV